MKKIFNKNILLIGLVFSAVLNDLILRALTVGNLFTIRPIITSIGILLIIGPIVILFPNKNKKYNYIIFFILFSMLNIGNYLYYTYFNSFLSLGIFKQVKQLSELKGNLRETLNYKVLLFLIPIILFIFFCKKLREKGYFEIHSNNFSLKKEVISPFILGLVLLLSISITLTSSDISRLVKQWNREYLVEQFGIYTFATADLIKTASVPRETKTNYDYFEREMKSLVRENKEKSKENEYTDILKGKDLYVIHYESAQDFAMDLSFGDGEVTPFLNKLSNESMFFNNFYPQHSVGTSSDSEFSFSTSLYPINNRTVFIDHADKEFETIQKLLVNKGYYTMSLHGNNGGFWNRDIMHPRIGNKEFLSKKDYIIDEEVGLGLSDKSFYKQSTKKIKERKEKINKPIMATLISLSNHYPFDDLEVYGDFDTGFLEGTDISNYLKSMNYADQALELFFEEMDKEGLLDNAVILIYGDHHAKISKSDYELLYNYDEITDTTRDKSSEDYISINNAYLKQVRKTPLIIWTKDQSLKETIEEPIGMVDVMPTLGNMLGVYNPYQLGQDIFNVGNNTVIFPNGSFLTKDYYYCSSNLKVYDMKSNELLFKEEDFDMEFLEKIEFVERALQFSSNIIENNLIKYYEKSLIHLK